MTSLGKAFWLFLKNKQKQKVTCNYPHDPAIALLEIYSKK